MASKQKGWIKLHKKLLDSAVWSDPLRLKAWVYILLSANYENKEWFANGRLIQIKRGQLVTSNRKLQEAWRCSDKTVRRILQQFAEMDMIKVETPHNKYTLISVVNYSKFQDNGHTEYDSEYDSEYDTEYDTEYDSDDYTDDYSEYDSDAVQLKNNIELSKNDYKNEQEQKKASPVFLDPGGYELE